MKFIKIYKMAFTLAEVLITLLIIGVVASLVIPAIIQDTQNAELKAAWKKAYSDISQATINVKNDLGGVLGFTNSYDIRDQYIQYLNYQTSCNGANWGGNCWHKPGTVRYYNGTYLDSADMNNTFANSPAIIMSNGNLIMFCRWNCDSSDFCGWISVDVNGFKNPNTLGKDIFLLWILKNQIQPNGSPSSKYPSTCSTNGGWECSARYLYN
jgi:type II secretory pathway pseudopilin PulG